MLPTSQPAHPYNLYRQDKDALQKPSIAAQRQSGTLQPTSNSVHWQAVTMAHIVIPSGLMLLNLVWFLWVARSFEYKAIEHPTMRQAPASGYKPQGAPAWVQPQIVQGVQQAHVSSQYSTVQYSTVQCRFSIYMHTARHMHATERVTHFSSRL